MANVVLITAPVHPFLPSYLTEKGFEVRYEPKAQWEDLVHTLDKVVGLILTTRLVLSADRMALFPQLKWIGRLGSGMELIDQMAATERGIVCESSPEGNAPAVGEQALGMLLSLLHKIHSSQAEVRQGQWIRDANRGTELGGKTLGIIGYGHTGQAFAKVLQGFGVKILAHDKYKTGFSSEQIQESSLAEIMQSANVISFHLPLSAETHHYANASFFAGLAKLPYLINTSRGSVVDSAALLLALQNGQVQGAALDVLEKEPLSENKGGDKETVDSLLALPQVLVTPHIAGYSHEAFERMARVLVKKLGI